MIRKTPRMLSILALMAASATMITTGALPAHAGPDDGKIIATRSHVDSPKSFWRNNTFKLFNEHHANGPDGTCLGPNSEKSPSGPCLDPIEDSIIYVGKGWNSYEKDPSQKYQFTLPDAPSSLQDLGKPGDLWYASPASNDGGEEPNWVGFGADTAIPSDTFRDTTFSLEMVSVNGPGRVEMFKYPSLGDYPADSQRLLSSSNPAHRSIPLVQGSHTHNWSVFSRPGRYEITYRTVARSTDGTVIASEPKVQAWQVGGQQPAAKPTASTKERYDAARSGDASAEGYSLSTSPKKNPTKDGDKNLTTITFDAGNPQITGTVTLFINGFFLTDLPVKNGHVEWDEMLGSAPSDLQAVFTPTGDEGVRWISPVVKYTQGSEAMALSAWDGSGKWPTEIPDPTNTTLNTDTYTPTSNKFTVKVDKTSNPDIASISIKFDDPEIRGYLQGGLYEKSSDTGASGDGALEEGVGKGFGEDYVFYEYYNIGHEIRVTFLPSPEMNMRGFTMTLPKKFAKDIKYQTTGHFTISADGSGPATLQVIAPDGQPAPSQPSVPPTKAPDKPTIPTEVSIPSEPNNKRLLLTNGHVDIQAALADDALNISLKDETGLFSKQTVQRRLDSVAFAVLDNTRHTREGKSLMVPELNFLGSQGDTFYALPQTQIQGTLWPGYNTQQIDYKKLAKNTPAQLHLDPVSMPKDGQVGMYIQDLLRNKTTVLLNTKAKDSVIDVDFATHTHTNWTFTKPGIYVLDAYYSAKLSDGKNISSEHQKLAILVGNEALQGGSQTSGDATSASDQTSLDPGTATLGSIAPSETTARPDKPAALPRTGNMASGTLGALGALAGVATVAALVTKRRGRLSGRR